MQKISEEGLNLIKRFEGFSPIIYHDAAGLPTIGYGHLLLPGEEDIFQDAISKIKAEQLLKKDVKKSENAVNSLVDISLTTGQFDALVSFTFNVGAGSFSNSTLLKKVNKSEHEAVPGEFMRWIWAGGRKLTGLMRRRQAEIRVYRGELF